MSRSRTVADSCAMACPIADHWTHCDRRRCRPQHPLCVRRPHKHDTTRIVTLDDAARWLLEGPSPSGRGESEVKNRFERADEKMKWARSNYFDMNPTQQLPSSYLTFVAITVNDAAAPRHPHQYRRVNRRSARRRPPSDRATPTTRGGNSTK